MTKEIESKLLLGDNLTMNVVDQFLGVSYIQKRVIPGKDYNIVIDLSEDRFYILIKTDIKRNGRAVFEVSNIFIWSRIVEVLLHSGVLW